MSALLKAVLRLLHIRSADKPVLAFLAPVFALVTAVNVVTMSFSKGLFLQHNPYEALPYMFLAAAVFTMIVTTAYVGVIQRWSPSRRLQGLLVLAATSYAAIAALVRADPAGVSLLVFAWCAGIGSLLIVQIWAWSSTLLPTRQARRLFPISSAVATLGASGGGALTTGILYVGDYTLLLAVTSGLLVCALVIVHYARRRIPEAVAQSVTSTIPAITRAAPRPTVLGQIITAFQAMRKIPLLAHLAVLAFLVQVASVVMDFQFSSALKKHLGADEIAGFLGIYYGAANLVTLFVALFAANRITRFVGIGVASGSQALVLVIGSGVALALGHLGLGFAFLSVTATSFVERVAGFGIGKQAFQAAKMPVPPRYSEPARFLINGVITRLAVIVVSVGFLVAGSDLAEYMALSPLLVTTSALALLLAFRVGPSYRRALLDALTDRRSSFDGGQIPDWARVEAQRIVGKLLATARAEGVRRGLALCRELRVPPPPRMVERLLEGSDPALVAETLEGLHDQPVVPRKLTLARLLEPSRPAAVLAGALAVLPHAWDEFADLVRPLMSHDDEMVASRAVLWLRGSMLGPVTRQVIRKRVRHQTGVHELDLPPLEGDQPQGAGPRTVAHRERSLGTLTRRFMGLVDRLPRLLRSGDPKHQRIALDLFVELALPEHVNLLVESLEDPSTRAIAMVALTRMPADLVFPELVERLAEADVPTGQPTRLRLLQLVERIGGQRGMMLLVRQLDSTSNTVRHRAVNSLWRMMGGTDLRLPEGANLQGRIQREIEELVTFAVIDSALSGRDGQHQRFLRTEVALRRAHGEIRIFRMLGLVYRRDAIEGAFAHYRSPDRRRRSNAIELLDTTIDDPDMRVVVSYVEGTEHRDGRSYTSSTGMMQIPAFGRIIRRFARKGQVDADPIDALLGEMDAWIQQMYRWAVAADARPGGAAPACPHPPADQEAPVDEASQEDVMERLFLLRGIALFDEVPADQLLPLAHVAHRRSFPEGGLIFEEGDVGDQLYLVARGEVAIEHEGCAVARFGPRECFGEMAILDDRPRSATARAVLDSECLVVGRADFDDLLDIAPGLARGVIRVLTRRLRNTLEQHL